MKLQKRRAGEEFYYITSKARAGCVDDVVGWCESLSASSTSTNSTPGGSLRVYRDGKLEFVQLLCVCLHHSNDLLHLLLIHLPREHKEKSFRSIKFHKFSIIFYRRYDLIMSVSLWSPRGLQSQQWTARHKSLLSAVCFQSNDFSLCNLHNKQAQRKSLRLSWRIFLLCTTQPAVRKTENKLKTFPIKAAPRRKRVAKGVGSDSVRVPCHEFLLAQSLPRRTLNLHILTHTDTQLPTWNSCLLLRSPETQQQKGCFPIQEFFNWMSSSFRRVLMAFQRGGDVWKLHRSHINSLSWSNWRYKCAQSTPPRHQPTKQMNE